jgi:CubicO group peptidase (beta-lactamase class C family)
MTMEAVAPEEVGFAQARLRRIDDAMHRLIDAGKIAGAVTLIARHGRVAQSAAYGHLNLETAQPMQHGAIFRLASMTKPITAVAVLLLFEEGHFLLDDPIADYIPEFAHTKVFVREEGTGIEVTDLERPITIRHLLTHTAGLTYDFMEGGPVHRMYAREFTEDKPLEDWVKRLATVPLLFQPGAYWEYSVGLDVLGRLVEVISGQPFDAFLRERLFNPLAMPDTGFFVSPPNLSRLAAVYNHADDGRLQRDDAPEHSCSQPPVFLSGGGGLVSTAGDYARFCQMLVNSGTMDGIRLLGRKTIDLLMANHLPRGAMSFTPSFAGFGGFNQVLGGAAHMNVALSSLPDCCFAGYAQALGGATHLHSALSGMPVSPGSYWWGGAYSTQFWIDRQEDLCGVFMCQLQPAVARWFNLFQVLTYQALDR